MRKWLVLSFGLVRLALAAAVLPVALNWRTPFFASVRPVVLVALIVASLILIAVEVWALRARSLGRAGRIVSAMTLALAAFAFVTTVSVEVQFRIMHERVLAADPQQLERLGRHVIVGYRNRGELEALVERRAIAGVFLGGTYAEGKTTDIIAKDIASLQDIRRRQGLPPLWIATDQEGGGVSRLSPPLPRLPPLSAIVAREADPAARERAVARYAEQQGRGLAAVGVNLNFAPVVDLNHGIVNPNDRMTRIAERAISSDPTIVAAVAGTYCATLLRMGVRCTLKHFPGLGRVFEDTHRNSADLTASLEELAASDWIPFHRLMSGDAAFTMLSHARLTALDDAHPTSTSRIVIGALRNVWNYDGVLVTDDFSMAAISDTPDGIAGSGVAALNAGVDLILVSYDPDQYFALMDTLLLAERDGRLRPDALARSAARLQRAAIFE